MLTERRLQDLADNIRQDLNLLKAYEDELRYETDPRRLARYRREIERQRESLTRYQQEYDELRKQVTGVQSAEMEDTANLLPQMDAKLDNVQRRLEDIEDNLKDLRKTLLARLDASERVIISAIVQQLDQNQLAIVQSILDEIGTHSVPENELQETLSALQQALLEIRQTEIGLYDSQLVSGAKDLSEMVDDPKLDVTHKLKVSIPIIPLILSYETEVELKSGVNLKAAWQRLKVRVRGER
jgi:septal ring factor EnvC (AmiA/AmiB activator)